MLPYKAKGATLVAPSIAQTPGSQEWLTQFMAKCPPAECGIGAIALHWYQEVTMMDYFKDYITKAHNNPAFGKLPVYVTEWAPQSVVDRNPTKDGEAKLAAFIKEACEWMDQQDWILGYAVSTGICDPLRKPILMLSFITDMVALQCGQFQCNGQYRWHRCCIWRCIIAKEYSQVLDTEKLARLEPGLCCYAPSSVLTFCMLVSSLGALLVV